MKFSIHSRTGESRGSSTLLVILVVVAFIVVVGLMVRSSSTISDREGEEGVQEGAVDSSFHVFETFDSINDNARGNGGESRTPLKSEAPARPEPAAPLPATDRPPEKGVAPGIAPTPIPTRSDKSDKGGVASEADTGDLNAPREGIESTSRAAVDSPADAGRSSEAESADSADAQPNERGARIAESIVEHILPDSGITPTAGTPVFIRVNRETAASVQLAAGHGAPGGPPPAGEAEQQMVARALGRDPLNRLSPPLFSLGSGKFPAAEFNLKLKLADPNPRKVSRILYSLDSTRWNLYEGSEIIVPPGTTVSAYCESLASDWRDSVEESRDYAIDFRKLDAPQLRASAPAFDRQANRRILVSILNPNSLSGSRIEYRFDGGLWQPYTGPFHLDAEKHGIAGVTIEARAVAVRGAPRPEDSDAVALEIHRPETPALAAPQSDITSIDPGAVDLGMPVTTHGYSERQTVIGPAGALADSPSAGERFVMDTLESYRRNVETSAGSGTVVDLEAFVVPASAAAASGLAPADPPPAGRAVIGRDSGDGGDFDLFESAIATEVLHAEFAWGSGEH